MSRFYLGVPPSRMTCPCDHSCMPSLDHRRCCVLLSGGIDSALVALLLQREGWAVRAFWVDYGQPAAVAERRASRAIAGRFELEWQERSVSGLMVPPEGEVPGRNDLLVAVAHASALSTSIAIGIHAGTPYPDCSREWISAWQTVLDVQHGGVVALLAPLAELQKPQVLALARQHLVPFGLTHSCERGSVPCGSCLSCRDRDAAGVGT